MSRPRLVCASANPDKVAEIAALLAPVADLVARPAQMGEVVEDADTLEGNARLKAAAVAAVAGAPAVADDTGLEVDALDGAPGVYSARFAGESASYADNRRLLLERMEGVPASQRTARFRTVVVVDWADGTHTVVDGVCEGHITEVERGAGGFGYDAVFAPSDTDGATFAEMDADAKNAISHRGRAFAQLAVALAAHQ